MGSVFPLSLLVGWTCLMFGEFKDTALFRAQSKMSRKPRLMQIMRRSERSECKSVAPTRRRPLLSSLNRPGAQSAKKKLAAAEIRVKQKTSKYKEEIVATDTLFQPMVVETLGGWHSAALPILKRKGNNLAESSWSPISNDDIVILQPSASKWLYVGLSILINRSLKSSGFQVLINLRIYKKIS